MFRLVVAPVIARVKRAQVAVKTAKKTWSFLRGLWVLWCSCQGLLKLGLKPSHYLRWLQGLKEKRRIGARAKVVPVIAQAWGTKDGKWNVVETGLGCL